MTCQKKRYRRTAQTMQCGPTILIDSRHAHAAQPWCLLKDCVDGIIHGLVHMWGNANIFVYSVLVVFPRMNVLHRQATHGWHNAPRHFRVVNSLSQFPGNKCWSCRFTIYGVPLFGRSKPAKQERLSPCLFWHYYIRSVHLCFYFKCLQFIHMPTSDIYYTFSAGHIHHGASRPMLHHIPLNVPGRRGL